MTPKTEVASHPIHPPWIRPWNSSFKFIFKRQNLISTVDKGWLETFTESTDLNGPKFFLKYTSFLLCDKRKRRNALKSCTGLQPNFNLKFSTQR